MTARGKVLIIEDEPMIRRICERVLVAEGFCLDCAVDGLPAETIIKEKIRQILDRNPVTPHRNDWREL